VVSLVNPTPEDPGERTRLPRPIAPAARSTIHSVARSNLHRLPFWKELHGWQAFAENGPEFKSRPGASTVSVIKRPFARRSFRAGYIAAVRRPRSSACKGRPSTWGWSDKQTRVLGPGRRLDGIIALRSELEDHQVIVPAACGQAGYCVEGRDPDGQAASFLPHAPTVL